MKALAIGIGLFAIAITLFAMVLLFSGVLEGIFGIMYLGLAFILYWIAREVWNDDGY
jgi:hypothetical protein